MSKCLSWNREPVDQNILQKLEEEETEHWKHYFYSEGVTNLSKYLNQNQHLHNVPIFQLTFIKSALLFFCFYIIFLTVKKYL